MLFELLTSLCEILLQLLIRFLDRCLHKRPKKLKLGIDSLIDLVDPMPELLVLRLDMGSKPEMFLAFLENLLKLFLVVCEVIVDFLVYPGLLMRCCLMR